MAELTIRSATELDIDSVLELWNTAGETPGITDNPAGISRLLATDPDALIVATARGVIVASLIVVWDGWRGSFYRLAVHPGHRRRGIATALLREGERYLRARGALRFTAVVADDDPVATAFWQTAGYERQAARARFVRNLGVPSPTGCAGGD